MCRGSKTIITCVLSISCFSALLAADLSTPVQLSRGQIAAQQLTQYSEVYWRDVASKLDAPVNAVYEKDHILMTIYGGRDNAEGAKETVKEYLTALEEDFIPYLREYFKIELTVNDIFIIYRNRRSRNIKKILIWERGNYRLPSD